MMKVESDMTEQMRYIYANWSAARRREIQDRLVGRWDDNGGDDCKKNIKQDYGVEDIAENKNKGKKERSMKMLTEDK